MPCLRVSLPQPNWSGGRRVPRGTHEGDWRSSLSINPIATNRSLFADLLQWRMELSGLLYDRGRHVRLARVDHGRTWLDARTGERARLLVFWLPIVADRDARRQTFPLGIACRRWPKRNSASL